MSAPIAMIRLQRLGALLSLRGRPNAAQLDRLRETISSVSTIAGDFGTEARRAAKKLSQTDRPANVAQGASLFKDVLGRDEGLRTATAAKIELDPHWMEPALLRAAALTDPPIAEPLASAIVEGGRRFFLDKDRVQLAEADDYSIAQVRQAVDSANQAGLLRAVIARFVEPETAEPPLSGDQVVQEWTGFEGTLAATRRDQVVELYNVLQASLMDHPLFGEFLVDRITHVSRETGMTDQLRRTLAEAHGETMRRRVVVIHVPGDPGSEGPLAVNPVVRRLSQEHQRVVSLQRRWATRDLPETDPRRKLFVIMDRINERITRLLG